MSRSITSFQRSRSGATALEFALIAPLLFSLVFSTFEAGWMMTKTMMLDRALNATIRQVRVGGPGAPTTQDLFKKKVCDEAMVLPDCVNAITVEMTEVKTASDFPTANATCVDRGSKIKPVVVFNTGSRSSIMFVRVCIVTDPFTPLFGLGLQFAKDSKGGYSIVSSSAFMNEPSA